MAGDWNAFEDEFMAFLKQQKKISNHTEAAYQKDIDDFLKFAVENGCEKLSDVTEITVNSWLLILAGERKQPTTLNRKLAALRSFFLYCLRRGYLSLDPTVSIPKYPIVRKEPKKLSHEEVRRFFSVILTADPKGRRDFLLFLLWIKTKQPLERLLALRKEDMNTEYGFFRLKRERGEQVYPLPKRLIKPLRDLCSSCHGGEDFVFGSGRNTPLTRQAVWKRLQQYAAKAGLEDRFKPNCLRNSEIPEDVIERILLKT